MAKVQAVMSLINDATLNSFPNHPGQITEQDIIKFLVDSSESFSKSKMKVTPPALTAQQMFNKNNDGQSQSDAMSQKSASNQQDNAQKLCMRIWSGYTKFLRSQCNKDRVIDSLYFGQFFRKEQTEYTEEVKGSNDNSYSCIHDPTRKNNQYLEFKNTNNSENFDAIPQVVRGREAVSVSIKAIAQVCGCSLEQVTHFLTKMRETAFQLCLVKKKMIDLNLSIGHLIISPNQMVEFKSVNKNDQQTGSALEMHDRSRLKSREGRDNSIFNSAYHQQKSKIDSLIKTEGEKKDYSHLSDFLKNQIHRSKKPNNLSQTGSSQNGGKNEDTISSISKKNKFSNQLIEKASAEIRQRKATQSQGSRTAASDFDQQSYISVASKQNSDSKSQGKFEQIQNLQSAFLLGKKSQADAQSYVSNTGSQRKNVNPDTLSDQKSTIAQSIAAKSYLSNRLSRGQQSQVKSVTSIKDKRGQSSGHPRHFAQNSSEKDRLSQSVKSSLSQRVSVTQNGGRRSINQTRKKSMDFNSNAFVNDYSPYPENNAPSHSGSQSMKGKKVLDPFSNDYAISKSHKEINEFYKTAEAHFKSNPGATNSNMKNLIGLALNRKQVSNQYHYSAYPYFLRSQGPYKVYDHAQAKGQQYVANLQEINEQAHGRFINECKKTKEVRDFEREQFGWQKQKQDIIAEHDEQLKKKNNIQNLSFLAKQIQQNRERKEVHHDVEKLYYKPHFGPEETDDALDKDYERKLRMKHFIKTQLLNQMNEKKEVVADNYNDERTGDLEQLQTCQNIFVAEERAREAKTLKEKHDNKMVWETQMQDRQLRDTMEKLFY